MFPFSTIGTEYRASGTYLDYSTCSDAMEDVLCFTSRRSRHRSNSCSDSQYILHRFLQQEPDLSSFGLEIAWLRLTLLKNGRLSGNTRSSEMLLATLC